MRSQQKVMILSPKSTMCRLSNIHQNGPQNKSITFKVNIESRVYKRILLTRCITSEGLDKPIKWREAIFSIIFICFAASADDISLYFHYFYDKMILLFTLLLHLCINQRLIIGSFHRFDRIWLTLFISSFRCGLTDRKLFITSQSS